jgi:hypothetical protein
MSGLCASVHRVPGYAARSAFSPWRIQIPPIRIIKTPMRLLITRITALNVRLIAHLETKVFVHLLREHIESSEFEPSGTCSQWPQ